MEIAIESIEEGISKVRLIGSLDVSGAQEIEKDFSNASKSRQSLVVDLSQLKFLSSQGIRALMVNAKAVGAKGRKLVLAAAPPQVEHTLRVAGIDKVIPMFVSLDEATASVRETVTD